MVVCVSEGEKVEKVETFCRVSYPCFDWRVVFAQSEHLCVGVDIKV